MKYGSSHPWFDNHPECRMFVDDSWGDHWKTTREIIDAIIDQEERLRKLEAQRTSTAVGVGEKCPVCGGFACGVGVTTVDPFTVDSQP